MDDAVLFRETQRFRQGWIYVLVLGLAALAWLAFLQQIVWGRPFGERPAPDLLVWAIFVLVGLAVPWALVRAQLRTEVRADHVLLHYRPFRRRRIEASEIAGHEVVTFRPIRDWGGWGLRWRPKRGWAWLVSGNRGVRLDLTGGRTLTVGSQRPEDLAAALRRL